MPNIHPTAFVDPSAQLADSVTVGPFSIVGPNCVLGDDTVLEASVHLKRDVTLGARNRLHTGVVIGDDPQHLAYKYHPGRVIIGDDNTFREYFTAHKPHVEGGETRIGNSAFCMANSHVAHDCIVGNKLVMANSSALAGHSEIGDNVTLSAFVGTHQFTRVGRLVMVGGISRVTCDVPPFCMVLGAHVIGLNPVGMRRAGIGGEGRKQVKALFKTVFRSGHAIGVAIKNARAQLAEMGDAATPEAREFVAFFDVDGKRAFITYRGKSEGGDD